MEFYDCHLHTTYSADGMSTVDDLCERALEMNMRAITLTDHNDYMPDGFLPYESIQQSAEAAKRKNEELNGKLMVLSGVEISDQLNGGQPCEPYYSMDLDCILGSIHSAKIFARYFSDSPYSYDLNQTAAAADMDFLKRFVEIYYKETLKNAELADVDVITHLTFPLRYINGKANRGFDITEYYPLIDQVLEAIIKNNKALEVNTSGMAMEWNQFMPDEEILKRYYNLGGRIVTVGSDAHKAENLGVGFPEAAAMLKRIGFTCGSYFVKRKRLEYKF